jgi:hypothetical protein
LKNDGCVQSKEAQMHFGFDSPEFWGFGGGTLILLGGLAYGSCRAGWLSRRERARVDAATLEMQRREVEPEQQPHPDYRPYERPRRSAADFPAALVPTHWWSKSDIGENG